MMSESSGVYSLDRDESQQQQFVTEQISQNMKNVLHSRPILNGSETVSLKVSEPMETDEEVAMASEAQKAISSCTSSVDNFTKQHAVFDEGEAPYTPDSNIEDIEKEQQVEEVNANKDGTFTHGEFEMPVPLRRKLHDVQGKSDIVEQESICYSPQSKIKERNESDSKALSDELKNVDDNEESKQNIETTLESFIVVSFDDVVCQNAVDDEATQPDSFGEENSKSVKPSKIEENAKEVSCDEAAKQESALITELVSTDFDVIDFNELFGKLESASIADSTEQNDALSAPNAASIGVIPPAPRRGLANAYKVDGICSPKQQSFAYDLPDISITPPTPRRLSFDSRDSAAPQSATKNKLNDTPIPSMLPPDSPTSNVQSSVDVPLPEIHIIPPTPRRQSLGSENDVKIAVAHGNGVNETKDLHNEQSSTSLLSSAPSPLIPRVWNWLEESIFADPMIPADDSLESEHQNEGGRIDTEGGTRYEGEKESANYCIQKWDEEEIEPEFFELKISEMATEWPFDEVDQIEQRPSKTFTCDIRNDDEDSNDKGDDDRDGNDEGGNDEGGNDFEVLDNAVDRADSKLITRSRNENLGKVDLVENEGYFKIEDIENERTALSEESRSTQLKEEKMEELRKDNEVLDAPKRNEESMTIFEGRSSFEALDTSFNDSCSDVEREIDGEVDKQLSLVGRNGSVLNEQKNGTLQGEQIVDKLESGKSPMPFESNASSSNESKIVLDTEKDNVSVLKSNAIDSVFSNNSTFAYIEDQLKEIDAHKLALKQRRDSGAVEEVTCGATCLDDLLDNEAHDEIAAGMDAFYTRISNCLGSMNNIDELLIDGNESSDITQDSVSQLKDLFGLLGGHQSEVDSLNVLGEEIMQANDENIKELVRKHLDGLNDNWQRVKEKVLSEQALFMSLPVEEQMIPAHREFSGKRFQSKLNFEYISDADLLEEHLPDEHLRYQILFSDIFDWLVICEESIRVQIPCTFDLDKIAKISATHMSIAFEICANVPNMHELKTQWNKLVKEHASKNLLDQQNHLEALWNHLSRKISEKQRVLKKKCSNMLKNSEFQPSELVCDSGKVVDMWLKGMSDAIGKLVAMPNLLDLTKDMDSSSLEHVIMGVKFQLSVLQEVIDQLQNGTEGKSKLLRMLAKLAREFDDFASNVNKDFPDFELQDYPEEAEISDEMSLVSTCATPTNPADMLSVQSFVISSNKNLPLEFFKIELDKFDEFLSMHERVVVEDSHNPTTPEDSEAAESQLLNCQKLVHALRSKQLPIQFIHHHIAEQLASTGIALLPEIEARYKELMVRAESTYKVSSDRMKKLTSLTLLWQSFVTRSDHLFDWIENVTNSPLKVLMDIPEYDHESVVIKLMRLSEMEKRAYEKQRVKDRVEREAKSLIKATGNNSISVKLGSLNQKWLGLRDCIRKERLRLDHVCRMWREFQNVYQDLQHWISCSRIILEEDQSDLNSIEIIEKELAIHQDLKSQIEEKDDMRIHLVRLARKIKDEIHSSDTCISTQMEQLNEEWQLLNGELESAVDLLQRFVVEITSNTLNKKLLQVESEISEIEDDFQINSLENTLRNVHDIDDKLTVFKEMESSLSKADAELSEIAQPLAQSMYGSRLKKNRRKISQLDKPIREHLECLTELCVQMSEFEEKCQELKAVNRDAETALSEILQCESSGRLEQVQDQLLRVNGELIESQTSLHNAEDLCQVLCSNKSVSSREVIMEAQGIGDAQRRLQNQVERGIESWLSVQDLLRAFEMEHHNIETSLMTVETFLRQSSLPDCSSASISTRLNEIQVLQNDITETKEKIQHQQRVARNCRNSAYEKAPFLRGVTKKIDEYDRRLANVKGSLTSHASEMSELFCRSINCEQIQREIESWVQIKESEFSAILNMPSNEPIIVQQKQKEKLTKLSQDVEVYLQSLNSINELRTSQRMLSPSPRSGALLRLKRRLNDLLIHSRSACEKLQRDMEQWNDISRLLTESVNWIRETRRIEHDWKIHSLEQQITKTEELIREAENKLCLLENVLYSKQYPVRDTYEIPSNSTLLKVQRCTSEMEERLTGLVEHCKMLKKTKTELEEFHRHASAFLNDSSNLIDQLKLIDKENLDNEEFQDLESRCLETLSTLEEQRRIAETLDVNLFLNNVIKIELELVVTRMNQSWQQLSSLVNDMKQKTENASVKWEQFRKLAFELLDAMENINRLLHRFTPSVDNSSIGKIKEQFDHVIFCQKDIEKYKSAYKSISSLGTNLLRRSRGNLTQSISQLLQKIDESWTTLQGDCTRQIESLRRALELWEKYTEQMEDLISWLRQTEKVVRCPLGSFTRKELEEQLYICRQIGHEIENKKSETEAVRARGKSLSSSHSVTSADEEIIKRQLKTLSCLWDDVIFQSRLRLCHLIELLENLEKFEEVWKLLDDWLTRSEKSLLKDIDITGNAQKQREHIKSVYKNEFEKYDQTRKRLEGFAIQIMSTGPAAPYSEQVKKRCQTINHRWEVLCREVGVSFRKVEETLFNLRLLEAVLMRLNEWLKTVEDRVNQLSSQLQESAKSRQKMLDLEVLSADVQSRKADIISVLRLCERLQESSFACPIESDFQDLLSVKDSFEQRWIRLQSDIETMQKQTEAKIIFDADLSYDYQSNFSSPNLEDPQSKRQLVSNSACSVGSSPQALSSQDGIHSKSESISPRDGYLLIRKQAQIDNWLTEIEIRLIQLQPFASGLDEAEQISKIQNILDDLRNSENEIKKIMEESTNEATTSTFYSSWKDEFLSRYRQAIENCTSWILDLSVPYVDPVLSNE